MQRPALKSPGAAPIGRKTRQVALAIGLGVLPFPALAENHASGDAVAGGAAFAQQCVTCHVVVDAAGKTLAGRAGRIGPNLYGVASRHFGSFPNFRYGDGLARAGAAAVAVTEENFVAYVIDPNGWLSATLDDPGARSRMSFQVRDPADAANIYAYLLSLAPDVAMQDSAAVRETVETDAADRPVTYAAEQADRGEIRYQKDCAECHGDDLRGGLNGGASLRSVSFLQKYGEGAPASIMFSYMSSAMPPSSPGRYSASNYADLMAYILKRNGFPAGGPLPTDLDLLDHLTLEK